jgi:hypothetical protein
MAVSSHIDAAALNRPLPGRIAIRAYDMRYPEMVFSTVGNQNKESSLLVGRPWECLPYDRLGVSMTLR